MARSGRLETLLVIAIVALVAVSVRAAYIPPHAELHVEASERKYDFEVGDPGRWFSAWSIGDGQAYAMIGIDPSGAKLDEEITETWYRFSRAGFGWAAFLFSLSVDDLVPYGMAAVGVLSLAGLTWLAMRLRPTLGPRSYLLLANPAIYIGFGGDTSEALASLLLAASLTSTSAAFAAALAVTRPTYLVALLGRWRQVGVGLIAAALLALYVLSAFGLGAMVPGGGRLGLPIVGFLEAFSLGSAALGAFALATVGVGVRFKNWAWIASGCFVLCFGAAVLVDPANGWRAAGFLPVLWAFGVTWRSNSRSISTSSTEPVDTGMAKPLRNPSDVL